MPHETVRLRIGNLAKAVLVTGQAYQDPKDALNEFVSNAADEYIESDRRGGRVRVHLRRRGRHPVVAVEDDGRGMTVDRLRAIARNLFESSKAGDDRTLGEKAIGILAFQQLGARCDIVSRPEGSSTTHALRLERGRATAILVADEHRRARFTPGTTAYVSDLDPDVARVLTLRRVADYLRQRRGPALARGDYGIEVIEGAKSELVVPERPDGIRIDLAPRTTLWGRIDFALYVSARPDRRRRVAVVGRAGTTILDDIAEIEEFDCTPWTSDQVSGQIVYERLQQSAGRRAVLRDRDAFPIFMDAVRGIEPVVVTTLDRIAREVDTQTVDRLASVVRRIFSRVLRELADIDNPMRSNLGVDPGDGALMAEGAPNQSAPPIQGGGSPLPPAEDDDDFQALLDPNTAGRRPPALPGEAAVRPDGRRSHLPSVAPDPTPGETRSRFDAEAGVVLYNDSHPDYLLVKDDEAMLLDYLAVLVVKEYVVYNSPRATSEEVAEDMVRLLVRVRQHLPRRAGRQSRP
jgi:hypothetical protein